MYCIKCGTQIADNSVFCPYCGAKTQAPAPAQAPAPQAAADVFAAPQDSTAAAAKPKKNLKLALIIIAVIAFIGLAVGITFIILDSFKKPGTEIVSAFEKTMKEDFKADIQLKANIKGISALMGKDTDASSTSAMSLLGAMGMKYDAELYVKGKGDDFRAKLDLGMAQMKVDSEGMTSSISTQSLGNIIGGADSFDEENTKAFDEKSKLIYDIVASRDILKAVSEDEELDEMLKKNFSENYTKLDDVFEDLLNDTDADYIIDYSKKDGAYNYTINIKKLVKALADNKTLDMKKDSAKGIKASIKEIKQDIVADISVSISGGKLDTVKITPKIDKNEIGTVTITFKNYGDVSDKDLEFSESKTNSGLSSGALAPSMLGYVNKSKLKTANANAKMAFTVIASEATDLEIDGEYIPSGTYNFQIENYDPDDKIQASLYDNFNYLGDKMGEIYYVIDSDGSVKFVQWRQDSSSFIGQYPDQVTDSSEAVWGEFPG